MARRYSRADKEKWVANPSPPKKRPPVRIPNKLGRLRGKDVDEGKIRVELNGLLPLEMTMDIELPTDDVITVEFEYIKLEKHCFTCFSLFHEENDCPRRSRRDPPAKERSLGITQRLALQRIEADKRRHDERRGYRRPAPYFVPPRERRGGDGGHRSQYSHYSEHRDNGRKPLSSETSSYRRSSPQTLSPPRAHHSDHQRTRGDENRVLSSGRIIQETIYDARNPETVQEAHPQLRAHAVTSQVSHTPSPRPMRERLEFPEQGSGGDGSNSNSRERTSALNRLSEPDLRTIISPRDHTIHDNNNRGNVNSTANLKYTEVISGQEAEGRVSASLRLGPSAVSSSKAKGKSKANKPIAKKKVQMSPLQGLNIKRMHLSRGSITKRKLCIDRDPNLPCDKAGRSTITRSVISKGESSFVTFVYGAPAVENRATFWLKMSKLGEGREAPWLLSVISKLNAVRRRLIRWSKEQNQKNNLIISKLQSDLEEALSSAVLDQQTIETLSTSLCAAYKEEEEFWLQRSRIHWLKSGDRNTGFFHAVTRQRRVINSFSDNGLIFLNLR
ncbi:hypothetical protein Bca4012_035475 [Brassica carinata]